MIYLYGEVETVDWQRRLLVFAGHKKSRRSVGKAAYFYILSFLNQLVEAGGIEPPSASTPPQGLHAYPGLFV